MKKILEYVLREQHSAYAVFSKDLSIKTNSKKFHEIIYTEDDTNQTKIWDFFPELIGSERQIKALQTGEQRKYRLEKIGRLNKNREIQYYNLVIFPLKNTEYDDALVAIVNDMTRLTELEQELLQQKNEIKLLQASLAHYLREGTYKIIGASEKVQRIRDFIDKIANIRNTIILLTGESGTGKNLVARAIHNSSIFAKEPFIEVNCAAIPDTLIESEIFGHEKGAFTNATSNKRGLLEEADGGTLFLDEIAELPLPTQSKFLSFIETKKFRRLGSTEERSVQTRIIVATNRDLKKAIEKKEFRQDLYFRINVISLRLPPLRELGTDIITIAESFINYFAADFGKHITALTPKAKEKLLNYRWPGNVRELRNIIERAAIFADGPEIDADDCILTEQSYESSGAMQSFNLPESKLSLFDVEKHLIVKALQKFKANQTKTAKYLGLTLDTLRYRMKKYDIE